MDVLIPVIGLGIFTVLALMVLVAVETNTMGTILSQCDAFFRRHSFKPMYWVTGSILKAMTSDSQARRQREYLQLLNTNTLEMDKILQRQIYLLSSRQELLDNLGGRDKPRLLQMEQELNQMPLRIWVNRQCYANLKSKSPGGILIAEFNSLTDEEIWKHHLEECIRRLGCCARGCGCCETSRRAPVGRAHIQRTGKTHCTIECGCCIRWRGFRFPDGDEGLFVQEETSPAGLCLRACRLAAENEIVEHHQISIIEAKGGM